MKKRSHLRSLSRLVASAGLLAIGSVAHAQLDSVAFRFDPAPLVDPATYLAFQRPVVSDTPGPLVAFHAKVRSQTLGGVDGLFTADPVAADALVALEGDVAGGANAFRDFYRPYINAGGDVAWSARLVGASQGVFRSGPTPVSLLGDLAPLASGTLSAFDLPAITDDGQVVFQATILAGPPNGTVNVTAVILRCAGGDGNCSTGGTGTLSPLVQIGDPVPDRPGRFLCSFNSGLSASNFGIAFNATSKLDCANALETAIPAVYRKAFAGALETVAMQGDSSLPFPALGGTTYTSFPDVPAINNAGTLVFLSRVTGVLTETNIYSCDGTCPAALAALPVENVDLDVDGNILRRLATPRISDAGDISFYANAQGMSGSTRGVFVWRFATDTNERIAAKGDVVPSLPGALFGKLDRPWISPGGRITFSAAVRSAGSGNRAIFVYQP
jgi:hypothetical protein